MGSVGPFVEGYFPAYFPVVILFFKWVTLWNAGVLNTAAWFGDIGLTFVAFDVWAITTKFKGQTLRLDGTSPPGEGPALITLLILHVVVYVLNVRAWLAPDYGSVRFLALFFLVATGGSPLLILGVPAKR